MKDNILHIAQAVNYFSHIPLEPHGKRPVLDEWQKPEARAGYPWFMHRGNIGGVIGEGFMVLDIDPRNGGGDSFHKLLEDQPLLQNFPPSVYTAGQGAHIYFKLPAEHGRKIKKSLEDYPGIDWLSGNRYVVLPGSTNGTGSWRWAASPVTEPPEFPLDAVDRLPLHFELPDRSRGRRPGPCPSQAPSICRRNPCAAGWL